MVIDICLSKFNVCQGTVAPNYFQGELNGKIFFFSGHVLWTPIFL